MYATAIRISSILVAASLACAGASAAQYGGSDVPVDPVMGITQNEISLTLIPGTPGQPAALLAAYNDNPYPGGNGIGVSYSTDGGASWTNAQLPIPSNPYAPGLLADAFDPTVSADTLGNLVVAQISTDGAWSPPGVSGLFTHRSTDGGVTWSAPFAVSTDPAATGYPDPTYRFNDRCQITADRSAISPYKNTFYVAWIRDRGYGSPSPYSDIYVSRSTDNGKTFNTIPLQINDTPGNDLGNMPVPRVAADGTVLVSWLDYNVWTGGVGRILLDKSSDGGLTWGADTVVATINLPPLSVTTGAGAPDARAKGAPVLATSPTNANELYIVYAADPDGPGADEADIFFIRSANQGATWSAPLRLHTDSTTNDQILPWMDVKPNGTIDIVWYDRQNDAAPPPAGDMVWDVFTTQSTDGGATFWPETRLNDTSFPTPPTSVGPWLGEYPGLAVDSGYAYVMWTSSFPDLIGDIYFDKVANRLCQSTPATGCRQSTKAVAKLKDNATDAKDLFKWVWKKGTATLGDFDDPVSGSATYRVCVYDGSASSQPLMEMDVPPAGTCGTRACWKATGTTGFRYANKSAAPYGIQKVKLKAGTGTAKVLAKGKGVDLPFPALPLTMPVTVQLLIDNGTTTECWQTQFQGTPARNDTVLFRAKQ